MGLALPGVEEGTSYGTPALRVRGKLLARLKEDGESLVLMVGFEERQSLLLSEPQAFYLTDHYVNYPSVLIHLSRIDAPRLQSVFEVAWRRAAPKSVVARFDAERGRTQA